jgi:hypothetical protein
MFFRLINSPATFQALMDSIFADLIAKGVVAVYLDNILIYTKTIKEHREITCEVLCRLEENDLYLCPAKCKFECTEVKYLGMLIRENHASMDPAKVQAVTDWPAPRNLKDVRGFLGFANFYRCFIEGFVLRYVTREPNLRVKRSCTGLGNLEVFPFVPIVSKDYALVRTLSHFTL